MRRYFLCGLELEQSEPVDTSKEAKCWELIEKLIQALDAHFSNLLEISAPPLGYASEEEQDKDDEFKRKALRRRLRRTSGRL